MLFEVLGLTYHIPITIELVISGVLLGMPQYSSRCVMMTSYREDPADGSDERDNVDTFGGASHAIAPEATAT